MIAFPRFCIRFLVLGVCLMATIVKADAQVSLSQVLSNDKLWGKDFPAVLASLKAWQDAGASQVLIFPNRVLSSSAFKAQQPAEAALGKFTQTLHAAPPQPQKSFEKLMAAAPMEQFQAGVIAFGEDNTQRVAWTAPSASLLAPDLTIAKVKEAIGPPQKVTKQLIQGEGDRRPIELTLYSYSNGNVIFAESNYSSPGGAVDRVLLNVSAASRVLFK